MIHGIHVIHSHHGHRNESFIPAAHSCHTFALHPAINLCFTNATTRLEAAGSERGKVQGFAVENTTSFRLTLPLLHSKTSGLTDYSSCSRHRTACEKLNEHRTSRNPFNCPLTHWWLYAHCMSAKSG